MTFMHLKPGDRVSRMLGGKPPKIWMEMEAVAIDEKNDTIECGAVLPSGKVLKLGWIFDRNSGCEEDAELGWGRKFGKSGSFLQVKTNAA